MRFRKSLIPDSKFFSEYSKLYDVQKEAVDKSIECLSNHPFEKNEGFKGKIILPTGTGKTRVAEFDAAKLINNIYETEGRGSVFGVACHRLMLANNLMGGILKSLKCDFNVDKFKIVIVNSGDYTKFISTEFADEVGAQKTWRDYGLKQEDIIYAKDYGQNLNSLIKSWNRDGFNVLFVILYQSISTILNADVHFDFLFCDEAHISTERRYRENMKEFVNLADVVLHFTATEIGGIDGTGGMFDETIYGKDIINKQPKDVVLQKIITPVELVLLELKDNKGRTKTHSKVYGVPGHHDVINSIIMGYESLTKRVFINQKNAGKKEEDFYHPVLFVSVAGSAILKEIKDLTSSIGQTFLAFRKNKDIDLYITSSNEDIKGVIDYPETNDIDYENMKKEDFVERLNQMEITRPKHGAIIINIDQLSEGIDLPSIDAVMIFRNLSENLAKLLQIIGRSVRRAPEDRRLIKDDSVKYDDFEKFVKPYAYVYLPISTFSKSEIEDIVKILKMLYSQYGEIVYRLTERETQEGITEKLFPNKNGFEKNISEEEMKKMWNPNNVKANETLIHLLESENLSDDEMETRMIKIFERAKANHETKKLQDFMNTFANKNAPHRDMYRYTMFNFSEYIV